MLSFSSEVLVKEVGASGAVVSIVIERAEDLEETLPAESVEVAFIEYVPSEIAEDGVKEKAPLESAVVVPNVEESIKRVTFEFGSAVPDIVGVGSSSSEILVKEVGASGAVVSIVMERAEDFEETLPAASVAVAFIEYVPSEIAEDGVKEKAPLVSAVVVPKLVESIKRVILELASALPVIVGVGSLVVVVEVAKEVGASGAVVSMVTDKAEDFEETLPAASVAVALTE